MHVKRCLASAMGIGLVFSVGAFGQSMIEYGHGVAKAGVAGAASGTGIAGIFTKLKDTSDDDKTKKHRYSDKTAQTEPALREDWREPGEPANAPLKMRTSSGVVVSGVSPSWMGAAYRDPVREPVRVRTVEWSNPAEEQAAVVEQQSEPQQGVAEQAGLPEAQPTASESAGPAQIVSPGHSFSASAGQVPTAGRGAPESAPQPLEPVTDAEVAGIRIGSRIDEVIRTLGRPTFSFTGIVGKGYTEKYVFKNGDDEKITVLTWAGIVTSVMVS